MYVMKCTYDKGLFGNSYVCNFTSFGQEAGSCLIYKEQVHGLVQDGLVKLAECNIEENLAYVSVSDLLEQRASRFVVPAERVIEVK